MVFCVKVFQNWLALLFIQSDICTYQKERLSNILWSSNLPSFLLRFYYDCFTHLAIFCFVLHFMYRNDRYIKKNLHRANRSRTSYFEKSFYEYTRTFHLPRQHLVCEWYVRGKATEAWMCFCGFFVLMGVMSYGTSFGYSQSRLSLESSSPFPL